MMPWLNKQIVNEKLIELLENLRDTMLPKLINAAVKVDIAEKSVESFL
jgi:hypothetical protein